MSVVNAYDGYHQHLSPEEFRKKQQTFITEKANLTEDEAAKFFPLYFEMQHKKRELNDGAWKLLHKGKDAKLSEAEYEEMLLKMYDLRIESSQLEKTYYTKFREVLSAEKIFQVQRAEIRFHRELLKGAGKPKDEPQKGRRP